MWDSETGERKLDKETGENIPLYLNQHKSTTEDPVVRKRCTFKIPNDATKIIDANKKIPKNKYSDNEVSTLLLFLIPSLCCFPIILCTIIVLEIAIHVWAHRKNKTLKDPNVYYKSPMHIYISEFCAICCEDTSKAKIGKIQDKRTKKYECFKQLVS